MNAEDGIADPAYLDYAAILRFRTALFTFGRRSAVASARQARRLPKALMVALVAVRLVQAQS